MQIVEHAALKDHSSMRLGGVARYLTEVTDKEDLVEALKWASQRELPAIIIGSGTNIIWSDSGYPGLVIVDKIRGFEQKEVDKNTSDFVIAGGEVWDEVVERTVKLGFSGIEQLSLIPGTAGATPVQNVGAYGCEIKDVLQSVEAYDNQKHTFVTLLPEECDFGYRTSRFKHGDNERFFITHITLRLTKTKPSPPFYPALQNYLDQNDIRDYTPENIRKGVIAVRTSKLPDPAKVANNGSFFANPIITQSAFDKLQDEFPEIVHWVLGNNKVKLSAAWLVERSGFGKDFHDQETGMATWKYHSLVLVNEHAKTTQDLIDFRQKIVNAVEQKFGVKLEQEPELI